MSGKFSLALEDFAKKASGNLDDVTRRCVIDVTAKIDERSPVGDRELWAINDIVQAQRDTFQVFMEDQGKTVSNRTLQRKFKTRGPKGYVGGRFRGNWQLGVDSAPMGELDRIDPTGVETLAENMDRVPPAAAGHIYHLVNNLPYAQRLEDGYSKQAPAGMVGLTVVEWGGIVRAAAEEVNK